MYLVPVPELEGWLIAREIDESKRRSPDKEGDKVNFPSRIDRSSQCIKDISDAVVICFILQRTTEQQVAGGKSFFENLFPKTK